LKALTIPLRLAFDDCDLVHAHYARFPIYAAALSGKPFIAHCHGSDLRLGVSRIKQYFLKKARRIIVATPDLLEYHLGATYLPTIVPWEFHDLGVPKKGAVYFQHPQDPHHPFVAGVVGSYTVHDRSVPYSDMPKVLNQYEYVINFHYPILSKTSLEALACGCKVVMWDGKVISNLPSQHRPEQVVDRLLEVYKEALSC